jgi:hypothetical protein
MLPAIPDYADLVFDAAIRLRLQIGVDYKGGMAARVGFASALLRLRPQHQLIS